MNDYNDQFRPPAEHLTYGPEPPPESPRRRRRWVAPVAALATLAVIGGVGAASWYGYGVYTDRQDAIAAKEAAAEKRAAEKAAARKLARQIDTCERQIGDFVESLRDIDSRLDVGLNQGEMSNMLGEASSEKNDVPEYDLAPWCADAYDHAEDAFDEYAAANSEWNDCIWESWCDTDYDIDLQGPWSRAESSITEASLLLRDGPTGNS